jgi:TonB family protein
LVDENGLLKTMRSYRNANEKEIAALNHALEGAPSLFEPALIEQIPVDCNFAIELQISEKLIKVKPVERMSAKVVVFPEFPGGDDALRKFIKTKLNYPLEAARLRIQGKVFVSFSVEKDGTVSEVFVARGVHPLLDEEALRVTKLMPKWKPGEVNGKPAKVSHTLPINFIL